MKRFFYQFFVCDGNQKCFYNVIIVLLFLASSFNVVLINLKPCLCQPFITQYTLFDLFSSSRNRIYIIILCLSAINNVFYFIQSFILALHYRTHCADRCCLSGQSTSGRPIFGCALYTRYSVHDLTWLAMLLILKTKSYIFVNYHSFHGTAP